MHHAVRVVHLTSAHTRTDTRIFLKQCRSLQRSGYDVTLVVADGKGAATVDGITIMDVGCPAGRLNRMTGAARRGLAAATKLDADIYHFHDPELIPVGLLLKARGKVVIFDSHEDVAKQIRSKTYLPAAAKPVVSRSYAALERYAARRFDLIICATPSIETTFRAYGAKTTIVANYPILGELALGPIDWSRKTDTVCYVGGMNQVRGVLELIEAIGIVPRPVTLKMAGSAVPLDFDRQVRSAVVGKPVQLLGTLDRKQVAELLSDSMGGIVTFLPEDNHVEALPNKMFEYMSAGLPVIASDFPLWRDILERREAGICVDPKNPRAIAAAIDTLLQERQRAERMGRNGQKAVQDEFNWGISEWSLLSAYETLCPSRLSLRSERANAPTAP